MFAPKVAKAATNTLAAQPSTFVARPIGRRMGEGTQVRQPSVGNQATLQPLTQQARSLAGDTSRSHNEQETNPARLAARGATTPGVSWTFADVRLFPPERRPEARSPFKVRRLPIVMQPKLAIGSVDDPLEQEADRIAEHVMHMPAPDLSVTPALSRLARKCAECEQDEQTLQTKTANPSEAVAGEAPAIVHEVVQSPGRPLDAATRAFFEPRFGHDFSRVRVHADSKAADSAAAVNALAYTVGQNIVFGDRQYAPRISSGSSLLAHELVHVMQQSDRSHPLSPAAVGRAGGPVEPADGDGTADAGARGVSEPILRSIPLRSPSVRADRSSTLRRAVSVPESGSDLKITAEPSTDLKIQNLLGKWRARPATPQAIEFAGRVIASCGPGESASGYVVGIVQVQTREVNNGLYRGAVSADGSVWIRRDLASVRPAGPCVDSPFGKFWNEQKPLVCNGDVALTYKDWPQDMYETIVENPLTKKPNYLKELHVAFDFTTGLLLGRPDGTLQTLRWARWNESWNYSFDTPPSGEAKISKGIGMEGTVQFAVPMAAPPEMPTHYAVPAKNCNTIDYEASDNPARIQASPTW